jgi:hypothetical protein
VARRKHPYRYQSGGLKLESGQQGLVGFLVRRMAR